MTKQHKEESKGIRSLIQNAEKGHFESSFQLFLNYDSGRKVKQRDEELSKKYFSEVENALIDKSISFKSLRLSNFRRFKSLDINFDRKMTVIIGDNGAGKTSIVEAIARVFSWFNNNLEKSDVNGRPVSAADIHVDSDDYGAISSRFQFDKKNYFDATLGRVAPGSLVSSPTEVTVLKMFASMYRYTAKKNSIIIPLLAFYSVERSDFKLNSTVNEKASGDKLSNRYSALKNALEGSGKLDDFSELYIELVNLAEGEVTKEVEHLRSQISTLEITLNEIYEGGLPPENDRLSANLRGKKEELALLLQQSPLSKYQRHLGFVNSAIEGLVPEVKNIEVDRSTGKPRLLVENFGNKVNISQLSQGQKMLVALTGDLARRLVTLNPEAAMPLSGHGVVIIDEVELHLHPKWQQEILIGLQNTFPNIQFIVTTHSPQILSTVDNKCIRQICLDKNGEPIIDIPCFQTKGVTSADVLARIMGTNSVPERLTEAKWVDEFSKCLKEQKRAEADEYLKKILSHFGKMHPVVEDCESQIRIAEMKMRLANNSEV
jgi:predicted ATP-binding protein involved in virulence